MSNCVVDSSVAVKWALLEADSPEAHQLATGLLAEGGRLFLLYPAQIETAKFLLGLRYETVVYDALFVAAVDSRGCDGVTADEPRVKAVGKDYPSIQLLRDW